MHVNLKLASCLGWRGLVALMLTLAAARTVAAPPAPPSRLAQVPSNTLMMAMQASGLQRCNTPLKALSDLGLQGSTNNDVLLDWDRQRPANSPVFALLGVETPNGSVAMSLNAAPEADGSCSVSAERISVAPVACKTIAESELIGYQRFPLLKQMTVYTQPNDPGSSVSLINIREGCLIIRRFARFRVAQ